MLAPRLRHRLEAEQEFRHYLEKAEFVDEPELIYKSREAARTKLERPDPKGRTLAFNLGKTHLGYSIQWGLIGPDQVY